MPFTPVSPFTPARTVNIEASHRRGGWRLTRPRTPGRMVTDHDRAEAAAAANDLLGEMLGRLDSVPEAWRLELSKAAFTHGRASLGLSRAFAARALALPGAPQTISALAAEFSEFSAAAAFRNAGAPIRGARWRRVRTRLIAAAAWLLGLAAFAVEALRTLAWPARLPAGIRIAVAVHAEVVNRTRHILDVLSDLDPDTTALVIIGRPQIALSEVRALLRERGWTGPVTHCFDLRAALRGLPGALPLAWAGVSAAPLADYRPAFREQIAAMFRVFLGSAAAAWWTAQRARPEVVVFGHNGLADTVLLDRAQQAAGAQTVHWMHGVSAGRIYSGVSDLCVHQCDHDARWHDRLGDYGRNMTFPASKPAFRTGASGWVVQTNFTHPGYTFYPSVGPEHELALMELVAEAARRAGVSPGDVVWKPHPVFYQVEPETRRVVTQAAATHGFHIWPESDRNFARTAEFETVITTPSGVALDVLKLGRLPVMVAFHPIDPDHMLSCFPHCEADVDALLGQIDRARDPARAAEIFEETWARIGPGRIPSFEEIVQAALSRARDGSAGERLRRGGDSLTMECPDRNQGPQQ